ncbi:MAG: ferrochelatase [Planctomycetaceae bacterium]|nr:ferrochelatase [Planctomycetaceae bacterium]
MSESKYDAILFVSFGGPEGRDDVVPFLENVLRGRNVPRERMLEVAEHYYHFDGISPINQQTRELIDAVSSSLRERGVDVPVYWGNRNWHPMLPDTLARMQADGVRKAIAFVTAAYSSYSSCRQYRENVYAACESIGEETSMVDKIRVFFNHPDFIGANSDRVKFAIEQLPAANRDHFRLAFTAHSIPLSMSACCNYVQQLTETSRLIAKELGLSDDRWSLVYQSRSGRPQDPWLEPDIVDHLRMIREQGTDAAIVVPIGFLSDHMEVLYDLDEEAQIACEEIGLTMVRAGTVGTHPRFVEMVCKLIEERLYDDREKEAVGHFGPNWDVCPVTCCPAPPARPQHAGHPAGGGRP